MNELPATRMVKAGIGTVMLILAFAAASTAYVLFSDSGFFTRLPLLFPAVALAGLAAFLASGLFAARPRAFVWALGLVSFGSALFFVLWARTEPVSDFALLYRLSEALRDGDIAVLRGSKYFTRWAYQSFFVMYQALVLWIFPGGVTPLLVGNALFRTGIVLLVYLISREVFRERTAMLAAVLYLLYPAPYFLLSVLTNQHISLFFLLLGVYGTLKTRSYWGKAACGLCLALGNAFRPDGKLLLISLAAFALLSILSEKPRHLRRLARSALPAATVLSASLLAGAALSALVVFTGVNPGGLGNSDPMWKLITGLDQSVSGAYSAELAGEVFAMEDAGERHALEREIIRGHLSGNPKDLLVFLTQKTAGFWGSTEGAGFAFGNQYDREIPVIHKSLGSALYWLEKAERLFFLGMTLACLLSAGLLLRQGRVPALLALCGVLLVLFFTVHVFIEVQPRYRYLVQPFFFFLSGAGLERLLSAWDGLRARRPQGRRPDYSPS